MNAGSDAVPNVDLVHFSGSQSHILHPENCVRFTFQCPHPCPRFQKTVIFVFCQSEEIIKDSPPSGQANLQVINSLNCPVMVSVTNNNITVGSHQHSTEQRLSVAKNTTFFITPSATCNNLPRKTSEIPLDLKGKQWYNFVVSGVGNQTIGHLVKQNVTPPLPGKSKLCIVLLPLSTDDKSFDVFLNKDRIQESVLVLAESNCTVISADHYKLTVQGRNSSKVYVSSDIAVKNGGIYTAVVQKSGEQSAAGVEVTLYEDLTARNVSMLNQIPQYFVITSGEILFSVTGEYACYESLTSSLCEW